MSSSVSFLRILSNAFKDRLPRASAIIRGFGEEIVHKDRELGPNHQRDLLRNVYSVLMREDDFNQGIGEYFGAIDLKLDEEPLTRRDGEVIAKAVLWSHRPGPRLNDKKHRKFDEASCPVDWNAAEATAKKQGAEWFLTSWKHSTIVGVEEGFLGSAWFSTLSEDFIPMNKRARNLFFGKISKNDAIARHIDYWHATLGKF